MLQWLWNLFGRLIRSIVKIFHSWHITIREAYPQDADDFSELILQSSPTLFPAVYGEEVKEIMQYLFRKRHNLFSFDHVRFAELEGQKAGMILGYDWKTEKSECIFTGFLLIVKMKFKFIKKLPNMIKAMRAVGRVEEGEYYITNIATYNRFQCLGIGTKLIKEAEALAKQAGAKRSALTVEVYNLPAINLYEKLGYSRTSETCFRPWQGKAIDFYRMCKDL